MTCLLLSGTMKADSKMQGAVIGITAAEAARNDYNLSPSRYVASDDQEPPRCPWKRRWCCWPRPKSSTKPPYRHSSKPCCTN